MNDYKISICTICMNRAQHLKETLLKNIEDNSRYENIEYVVIDYNSQDGLEDWAKENLADHIRSGKVVYYKTSVPQDFKRAHSKNMAGRVATGDILCFVDADNFTGKGFAAYVNKFFQHSDNHFITTVSKGRQVNPSDVIGRVCLKRTDFLAIEGYDEFMNTYGYEDVDLVRRMELLGRKRFVLRNKKFFGAIRHDSEMRLSDMLGRLQDFYVSHTKPSESDFLYVFKDETFSLGTVVNLLSVSTGNPINGVRT